MKCAVCKKAEAEFIVAPNMNGSWQLECLTCETGNNYWIRIIDLKRDIKTWLPHLCQKNWFDPVKFIEVVRVLINNPDKELIRMQQYIARRGIK